MDLDLELRTCLHLRVCLVINIVLVDELHCLFEDWNVYVGFSLEVCDQGVVESNQVLHLHLQKEFASLGVLSELVSVDVGVPDLALSDEVDEFILGHLQVGPGHIVEFLGVDQVLIGVVDLLSVHLSGCYLV